METVNNGGVAGDEFFGVVRRRHPDVDIILLPPDEPTGPTTEPIDPGLVESVPAKFDAELADLWSEIAPGIDRPELNARWGYGTVKGSVSREALVAVEGIDGVAAHEVLARAERVLVTAGWHTLAPPDGIPRVLASRGDDAGERELQIIYVEATSRFALKYAAGPFVVGDDVARATVTANS